MSSDPVKTSRKLAGERTRLARQRNLLAAQRTFSAWIRTGIAAVAAGLGIAKLLSAAGAIACWIGIIFTAAGTGVYVFALWSYYHTWKLLREEAGRTPGLTPLWVLSLLVVILTGAAILVFMLILR